MDGFSQLFSQFELAFLIELLPYRESTPFLRVLTGAFADPAFDAGTVTCEAAACTPGVLAQYDFFLFDREHGTMWGAASDFGEDYGVAW